MSDAPERIWAGPDEDKGWGLLRRGEDVFWEDPENSTPEDRSGLSEYVRADLSNALVAAAYAAAVDACGDYPRVAPDRDRWEPYDEQIEYSQECIRALTPADAQAALDALVEARVAEKVREALTEAASLDWRNMFLAIIDRMRKAGESKEMASRWAGCEFSKAILDLRDRESALTSTESVERCAHILRGTSRGNGNMIRAAKALNALAAERDALLTSLAAAEELLAGAGICEIAARNPSVMEYMAHWEGRADAAEAREAALLANNADERNWLAKYNAVKRELDQMKARIAHVRALTDKGDTDNDG